MNQPPHGVFLPRLALFLALAGWLLAAGGVRAADREVVVLPTTGVVDDAMAGYLEGAIATAAHDGAAAVVVELNTPGGSLDATQRIVSTVFDASLPVIVWVAPAGGRAASAGTFITLAAHVAVMAPGTNIGAASPVDSSGADISGTMGIKVKNDAIAKIRSIAEARGRNVDWAVQTVDVARSSSATEALQVGAIDAMAGTIDEVLVAASGRTVKVGGAMVTLDLAGASIREAGMNPFIGLLHALSDPNIAFILFAIGLLALFSELHNPTLITGIVGAFTLILAFVGFGSLPLNAGGVVLIGLGVGLFVLEALIVSHGLLALGGIACFALGGSALYTGPIDPFEPIAQVGLPLLIVTTVTAAVLMGVIVIAAVRARRLSTEPGLAGGPLRLPAEGVVRRPLDPIGSVHVAGEEWTARTADSQPVPRGTAVRVLGVDGLTLIVAPVSSRS